MGDLLVAVIQLSITHFGKDSYNLYRQSLCALNDRQRIVINFSCAKVHLLLHIRKAINKNYDFLSLFV